MAKQTELLSVQNAAAFIHTPFPSELFIISDSQLVFYGYFFMLSADLTLPHLSSRPVICMCGQAVEWSGILCQSNSSPFVAASHSTQGLVMTSWKESNVLPQITSLSR